MALVTFTPGGTGPGAIAKLVWASSQCILEAAAQGHREAAGRLGIWLANTRSDPRCTPALARTIDHALEAGAARLGNPAGATARCAQVIPLRRRRSSPNIQPDDGEVA